MAQITLMCGPENWKTWHHWLFQLGNFLILLTFVPVKGHWAELYSRSMAAAGLFSLAIWAWLVLCLPDVIAWNIIFSAIHGYYINGLFWEVNPFQTFDPVGEQVYKTLFKPLGVSRLVFSRIYRTAKMKTTNILKETLTIKAFDSLDIPTSQLRMVVSGSAALVINEKRTLSVDPLELIETPFLLPRPTKDGPETVIDVTFQEGTVLLTWKLDQLLDLQYHNDKHALGLLIAQDIVSKIKKVQKVQQEVIG
jgi:hypothetical protein